MKEIASAKQTILVQAYSFTSQPITDALIQAHQRGVRVEVILDKGQKNGKGSKAQAVASAGIPTLIDSKHAIAHNKIMIIDGETIITGSFNFTGNAEDSNAENLLIIKDQPALVKEYEANYAKHKEHSEKYVGNDSPKSEAPAIKDNSSNNKTEASEEIMVYVTKSGTKYHRAGCRYLAKSCIPMSLKEAKVKYGPCSVCNPPK